MDDAESFTKGLKQLLNAIFRMQAIEGHSESGRTSYFVISLFYLSFWVNFVLTFHLGSICICFAFVSSRFYMGKLQLVFQDLFNIKWYMLAWRVITLSWLFGIQLAFCFKLSFFFFAGCFVNLQSICRVSSCCLCASCFHGSIDWEWCLSLEVNKTVIL